MVKAVVFCVGRVVVGWVVVTMMVCVIRAVVTTWMIMWVVKTGGRGVHGQEKYLSRSSLCCLIRFGW